MILNYSPVVNVCCCHSGSRKDTRLWKDLEKQLAPLIRSQQMTLWHSGDIKAGQVPRQEIKLHIASADVILLLISSDFLSSTFGREQMGLALYQFYQQQIPTIPVLLRPSTWELTPVFQLEPLPCNRRPVSLWSKPDLALLEIAQGILSVIVKLQTSPRTSRNQQTNVHRRIFSISSLSKKPITAASPLVEAHSIEEVLSTLQGYGPGIQARAKYRLAEESLVSGSIIGQHLPLGVPGFIPVSVSISPDRSATKNITELAPTLLTSDGVMIYGVKKNEHIPAEAVGDIIIQY